MKLKTAAFALLVATMAIDSRFDVVASSSSSSILDGSDPQATRKTRRVLHEKNQHTCQKEQMEIAGLEGDIFGLKQEIETLKSSPNDYGGDNGEVAVTKSSITAVYHRPHYECGDGGTTPDKEVTFIETQMKDNVDFIGLSEYEASNVIRAWTWNFGMIGATCKYSFTEPIRLYYNKNKWTKVGSYPKSDACQNPQNPPPGGDGPGSSAPAPWKCGKSDVVPNTAEGECCSCTYKADQATDQPPEVRDRAWVAGIFQQTSARKDTTVCVVATGLPRPPQTDGRGTGIIGREVAKFCGEYPIIFMADTNLSKTNDPLEETRSLFKEAPLSNLRDFSKLTYTCCQSTNQIQAMDRIAVTGTLTIETITGGVSKSGRTDWPDGMGYQCQTAKEHLPIKATITVHGIWDPIPKSKLKNYPGSGYDDCLEGYYYYNGFWVFNVGNIMGRPCDIPNRIGCRQFCNEVAGGCAHPNRNDCKWDEAQCLCLPFPGALEGLGDDVGGDCTGSYQDPYASGKNVPCCDGLEEQLNTWDRDGNYYYKCMDKDAWKPIKQDLKCSGSDYFKCLNAYIRPNDGVWVLEEPDPRGGPPDPECTNWPKTNEQLCNECAGGCAEVCSTDGSTFCNPPKN